MNEDHGNTIKLPPYIVTFGGIKKMTQSELLELISIISSLRDEKGGKPI